MTKIYQDMQDPNTICFQSDCGKVRTMPFSKALELADEFCLRGDVDIAEPIFRLYQSLKVSGNLPQSLKNS